MQPWIGDEYLQLCLQARQTAEWSVLPTLESVVCRLISANQIALPVFSSLLLPLPVATQRAVAYREAAAIVSLIRSSSGALGWQSGHASRDYFDDGTARRWPLRVVLMRGSANGNVGRLATLLSLSRDSFEPQLVTSELEPGVAADISYACAWPCVHAQLDAPAPLGAHALPALWRRLSHAQILLDACGHTRGHQLGTLAARPAPVATSVLGFPGSYGGHHLVDYLTADAVVCAPVSQRLRHLRTGLSNRCYASEERVAYLPASYQPPSAYEPSANGEWRNEWMLEWMGALSGVRRAAPLVGCFTRVVRWHPSSFELWMGVLRRAARTPSAALVLLADDRRVKARIAAEAAARGVAVGNALVGGAAVGAAVGVGMAVGGALGALGVSRVHFVPFAANKAIHLARHARLALCVDTTPTYGSHTTAADCLSNSVPLLTLPGEGWATRVGSSLMRAAGTPQSAVRSMRDLEDFGATMLGRAHGRAHGFTNDHQTLRGRPDQQTADDSSSRSLKVPTLRLLPFARRHSLSGALAAYPHHL